MKFIILFFVLFLLTSLFCWVAPGLMIFGPFCGAALFLIGILGVVVALDAIETKLFP